MKFGEGGGGKVIFMLVKANDRNCDIFLKFHKSKDQNLLLSLGKDSKRYLDPPFSTTVKHIYYRLLFFKLVCSVPSIDSRDAPSLEKKMEKKGSISR